MANMIYRPSPLAGLSEGIGTLADAIIKGREQQALNQDMSLIGEVMAQGQQPSQPTTGFGEESGDPYTIPGKTGNAMDLLQGALTKMKTPQGKNMVLKLMMQNQPTPFYSYEGGQMVKKGELPARGELLKPDPAAAQLALEEKRQAGREKLEGMKEDARDKLAEEKRDAWENHDQRRFEMAMAVQDKRAALQEKLQAAKTDKDRSEISRKDLLNVWQRTKENYNRRVGNIRKQFTDIGGGVTEPDKMQQELDAAKAEYDQDLRMVQSGYGDIIDKYGIKMPGQAAGVQKLNGAVLQALPPPGQYKDTVFRDTLTGKRYKSDGQKWNLIE
jgi:hypothetical protein